jgi:two-component system, NtrC family, response regulator HupR/HoxA
MDRNSSVLLVTDGSATWRALLEILAERFEYRVLIARADQEATTLVDNVHVDLALAQDTRDIDGCGFLVRLRTAHPEIMRVIVLGEDSPRAREAVSRASVYQFLRQPLDAEQASLVVKRGLEARELARRHRLLSREFKLADGSSLLEHHAPPYRPQSHRFEKLVYVSERMAQVCEQARMAARTDLPILIQGETGTGKELLARAIHYNSTRRESPLITQNCGGVPPDLLQSELFGHKRGAFTGAISDRLGLFRAADGGTVFLDEISEVSPSFQVSLLRFLQEGEIKPLGADQVLTSNVRIIAASNRPLDKLVATGEFRRDLYYRLKGFEFELPPLRERTDDIAALAEFFAAKHGEANKRKILGISASVLEKLTSYEWRGNIRELETEIRKLVVLTGDGEYLTTRHLSPAILAAPVRPAPMGGGFANDKRSLKDRVENLEKHLVQETLVRYRWNQSRAADELGLSRVGLANKIRRYHLDRSPAS